MVDNIGKRKFEMLCFLLIGGTRVDGDSVRSSVVVGHGLDHEFLGRRVKDTFEVHDSGFRWDLIEGFRVFEPIAFEV